MLLFQANSLFDKPNEPIHDENNTLPPTMAATNIVKLFFLMVRNF